MKMEEYYIKDHYDRVIDSLKLFQEDPLVHKPGMYCTNNICITQIVRFNGAQNKRVFLSVQSFIISTKRVDT